MIESTTIRATKTNSSNGIQAENKNVQSFRPQQFQGNSSNNPCHDGCNVTEKQLQASRAETATIEETNAISEQSSGVEKTSGGNCPGSNVIANILQQLFEALESVRIGR